MTQFSKIKAIAAAAGVCAAFGIAAPAHAYVYGLSNFEIANLNLVTSGATVVVNSYNFNLSNSSALNGPAVVQSASCNSFGAPACSVSSPVLDALASNAPGSSPTRTNNNFAFLGTAPLGSYSGSDSVITTAAVVQGVPTSTHQIAESLLNTNGFAQANALVQSNTSLTFNLTIGSPSANLNFNFQADPDLKAEIAGPLGLYLAQADLNTSFTLSKATGGSVSWAPRGTVANDCIVSSLVGVTCTETADTQSLNTNVSTATNPGSSTSSFDVATILTAFGINISGLGAGDYTLALSANTSTLLTRQVPEPATTGLLGLALAGLAWTTTRRNKKQA